MQLTILRRLVAATAVAATSASLAVVPVLAGGPAAAADPASAGAATRADTSLSIRAVNPAVRPGRSSTIKGRLAVPGGDPSGRPVLLEARAEGTEGFIPVGASTTGVAGILGLQVTPETTTLYRWRYAGAVDADRAVSGVARVRVRLAQHPAQRIRTTLSIRLKDAGDQMRIRGRLFGRGVELGQRWIVLVSRPEGAAEWGFESAARTDGLGRVVFGIEPHQQTAYRLAFLGTVSLRPSRSARVVVRMPSQVSISAVPGVVDPGGSSTVSGAVTAAGLPVPGATVNLLAREMHPGSTWAAEQTGTAAADGAVAFTVTPEHSTAYRLRVVHSPGVRHGISPIARVVVRVDSSLSIRGRTVGEGYVVDGQLRAARSTLPGRTIGLQAMAPGTIAWTPVASGTTNSRGRVRFVQVHVPDTQYRLVYDGELRFLPTVSGTVGS